MKPRVTAALQALLDANEALQALRPSEEKQLREVLDSLYNHVMEGIPANPKRCGPIDPGGVTIRFAGLLKAAEQEYTEG
jgi:hypothetical protein